MSHHHRKPPLPECLIGWESSSLTPDEREGLLREIRVNESPSLESAKIQGERLLQLNPHWSEMTFENIGMSRTTAYRKMRFPRDPKMKDPDWVQPDKWSPCSMILEATTKDLDLFAAMKASPSVNHRLVSEGQIKHFIRAYRIEKFKSKQKERPKRMSTSASKKEGDMLNVVTWGDVFELMKLIPDGSIDLLLTSPPYVKQRDEFYPGVEPAIYHEWILRLMTAFKPKLKVGGSALFIIRANIVDGRVLPWLLRARLKVQDEGGWIEPGEMIWHKPDRGNQGSHYVLRPNWEHILWFGKPDERQYIDRKACGKWSENIGYVSSNRFGLDGGVSDKAEGIANHPDVFLATIGDIEKKLEEKYGIDHPAMFPPTLVDKLIRTFSREGSTIFDPFVGSGTTALVAKVLKRNFYAFDIVQSYVDLANARLATEYKYEPDRTVIRGLFEDEE